MSEKVLKTRIKMKNGTPQEWAQATNFSPLEGELIVYNGDIPRIKIGDGSTNVEQLPFITDDFISIDLNESEAGVVPKINSDQLGGVDAEFYALKTDTAPDSNLLGGKEPEYYLPVVQLLGNPDFAIAQAGYPARNSENSSWISGLHGSVVYAADRWPTNTISSNNIIAFSVNGDIKTFTSNNGYAFLCQKLWKDGRDKGKSYTVAIELSDGSTKLAVANISTTDVTSQTVFGSVSLGTNVSLFIMKESDGTFLVRLNAAVTGASVSFKNIRMYEGTYTEETLPPYMPPDPVVELAKCQYYFDRIKGDKYAAFGHGIAKSANIASIFLPKHKMALTKPSLAYDGAITISRTNTAGASSTASVTTITADALSNSDVYVILNVTIATEILIPGESVWMQASYDATAHIDLSADLQ